MTVMLVGTRLGACSRPVRRQRCNLGLFVILMLVDSAASKSSRFFCCLQYMSGAQSAGSSGTWDREQVMVG